MKFELKNISKVYNKLTASEVTALKDVSLEFGNDDFISIMGVSGSGKSTLLNIIGCLDVPTEGNYFIDDVNITTLDVNKIRNEVIGFVLQNFGLLPNKSVYENVAYPLLLGKKVKYSDIMANVEIALNRVGMVSFKNRLASQLSGGQRQRVAIARAIVGNPALVLADEPTAALDSLTAKEIMALFNELNEQGTAIIIVTHDPAVAKICHKKLYISDGCIREVTV